MRSPGLHPSPGASGAIYGVRALELLQKVDDVESHVIITPSAQRTSAHETSYRSDEVRDLADHHHHPRDIGAAVSSGSFATVGMLVAPCSALELLNVVIPGVKRWDGRSVVPD